MTIHLICDKCFRPLPYVDISIPMKYAQQRGFRAGVIIGLLTGAAVMWLIC